MSHIVLAAGGTGGHMVPASVLARELSARGHRVSLLSDARGLRFPGLWDGVATHVIPAASIGGANPVRWLRAGATILRGRAAARALLAEARAVVGFGGYPALPALLAAFSRTLPTAVHEQNAVLGRVNRLLAGRVDVIATAYAATQRLPAGRAAVHTGNPVRAEILAARERPYAEPRPGEPVHVLVSGGSQGAAVLSRVVPAGLALLDAPTRARLRVVHQARPEDLDAADAAYAAAQIAAECAPYLADFPARLAWSHLNIARSGASTMAELSAAGRPAVLIPFGAATDDHQTANARAFVDAGGGVLIAQGEATPGRVRDAVAALLTPGALTRAAGAARGIGLPDAGTRLADVVEQLL